MNARQFIKLLASDETTPADRLAFILESAEHKRARSGLPELSIEDIDAYIAHVRKERMIDRSVSSE